MYANVYIIVNRLFPSNTLPPLNLQRFTSDPLINLVLFIVGTSVGVESSIIY